MGTPNPKARKKLKELDRKGLNLGWESRGKNTDEVIDEMCQWVEPRALNEVVDAMGRMYALAGKLGWILTVDFAYCIYNDYYSYSDYLEYQGMRGIKQWEKYFNKIVGKKPFYSLTSGELEPYFHYEEPFRYQYYFRCKKSAEDTRKRVRKALRKDYSGRKFRTTLVYRRVTTYEINEWKGKVDEWISVPLPSKEPG